MINHFNFKRIHNGSILITNDFGFFAYIDESVFQKLLSGQLEETDPSYDELHHKLFILEPMDIYSGEIATILRNMKSYVFSGTSLHIIVVTNVCNLKCVYCQAQVKGLCTNGFMTMDTAKKVVDITLQSPEKNLSFELQGGEPLANFPVIKGLIEYTESVKGDKEIQYSIVTNLSLLTDSMLDFLIQHQVSISTSIDGPDFVHNKNRVHQNGEDSYQMAIRGINRIKARDYPVGAIQTTTRLSLQYPKEIVQEYKRLGLHGIFLRPLTPLGFAKKDWQTLGYTPEEFLTFYKIAFEEILKINLEGTVFPELNASYYLKKLLNQTSYNYMELRSPCGAGIGQMAYYYDGNIYTCDEARMVAEAGDKAFLLGTVEDSYEQLVSSPVCSATCKASVIEGLPFCCDCVYQPYCGVCPVVNYASNGDIFPVEPRNYRCQINSGIIEYLLSLIRENDEQILFILKSWIEG